MRQQNASVDFIITNPRHHLSMFGPLCKWLLKESDCRIRILSLCELRGFQTPESEIREIPVGYAKMLPFRLSKGSLPRRSLERRPYQGKLRRFLQRLVWYGVVKDYPNRRNKPSLVVLPNDSAYPYDLITSRLRRLQVPFLLMQEGIRFELPSGAQDGGRLYGGGGAIAIAAWGSQSAEYFESIGVPQERIHLVGNPRLDAVQEQNWQGRSNELSQELGSHRNILLYVSNPIDQLGLCSLQDKYEAFASFIRFALPFLYKQSYHLIVKIHTGESLDDFENIVKNQGAHGETSVLREAPLYPLLYMAKAVIAIASTVGLEALLMNRPLGILPVPGHGYVHDYVDGGGAIGLHPDRSLPSLLEALIDEGEDRRALRKRYLATQVSNPGPAAESAGQLVLRLLDTIAVA